MLRSIPPLLLVLLLVSGSAAAQEGFNPQAVVVLPAESLDFQPLNPVISMAAAYGDRSKGAHGSFGRFPANFITPFHTHSGAYHGIVIAGTMTNPFKGEKNPPQMAAGSYWYVPTGRTHATACVSDTPCALLLLRQQRLRLHTGRVAVGRAKNSCVDPSATRHGALGAASAKRSAA